jgi:DNA-binding NtrC family response regulator
LVVDDERDFLQALVARLKLRQVEAVGVEGGQAALDYLADNPMDLVILDVKMPGMDGIQALQEIKARHPLVEVILLTGHASIEAGVKGLEMGAFDYLIKPVKLDELMEKLAEAQDRRLVRLEERG